MKKWSLKLLLILSVFPLLVACNKSSNTEKSNVQKVANTTDPVLGVDVSHFQGDVNWTEIKSAGISFVYTKATQGETYHDPKFKNNWSGAKAQNLYRGAYHFYVSKDDPLKQAQHFIKTVETIENGDLPPVLDLEQAGMTDAETIDKKLFQEGVLTWLNEVEKHFGIKPMVYTNHPFGDEYLTDPRFADYKLWIAEYEINKPRVPKAWTKNGWVIWQRSERGKIEGAIGNVDHDLLNGDLKFLKSIAKENLVEEVEADIEAEI